MRGRKALALVHTLFPRQTLLEQPAMAQELPKVLVPSRIGYTAEENLRGLDGEQLKNCISFAEIYLSWLACRLSPPASFQRSRMAAMRKPGGYFVMSIPSRRRSLADLSIGELEVSRAVSVTLNVKFPHCL